MERRDEYFDEPTPHLTVHNAIPHDLYEKLVFPNIPRRPGGRIGRDLYPGEPGWDEVLADPSWSSAYQYLIGDGFIFSVIDRFKDAIGSRPNNIDVDRLYLDPFVESRDEMHNSSLARESDTDPNSLFVRFDMQASDGTHGLRTPHVDHHRRLIGGVLFMCDAEEEGMEGGDFGLWQDEAFKNDRKCHRAKLAKALPIRHNTAYFFLNCNEAFHGPLPLTKMTGMRKWIYFSISSRRDVWQFDKPRVATAPGRVRRRVVNLAKTVRAKLAPSTPLASLRRADRKLIRRIRSANLTYLSEAKLARIASTCRSIEKAGLPGAYVEAGCALGGSSILLSSVKMPSRPLYIYDTFGMIPPPTAEDTPDVHERYRVIVEGKSKGIAGEQYYGYVADLQEVVSENLTRFSVDPQTQSVSLVKGLLQDTMHLDEPIAFAHIDVDWYDPVKTCLERLFPRLVERGSLILDDYHDWGGCRKATDEFLKGVEDQVSLDDAAGSMKITRVAPAPKTN